jgi:hypothetical protein
VPFCDLWKQDSWVRQRHQSWQITVYGVAGKDGDVSRQLAREDSTQNTRLLNIAAPRGGCPVDLFSDYHSIPSFPVTPAHSGPRIPHHGHNFLTIPYQWPQIPRPHAACCSFVFDFSRVICPTSSGGMDDPPKNSGSPSSHIPLSVVRSGKLEHHMQIASPADCIIHIRSLYVSGSLLCYRDHGSHMCASVPRSVRINATRCVRNHIQLKGPRTRHWVYDGSPCQDIALRYPKYCTN